MLGFANKQSFVATSGRPRVIGQRDQAGLDRLLDRQAMAMQFHDRAVGKRFAQRVEQAFGLRLLALGEQAGDRTGGAAGQQEQALGMVRDHLEAARCGFSDGSVSRKPIDDRRLQVGQTRRVVRQQHQRVGRQPGIVGAGQGDLAADDRLDALAAAYWENSSAPNRLPVSVMATAGIALAFARAAILSGRIAPSLSE